MAPSADTPCRLRRRRACWTTTASRDVISSSLCFVTQSISISQSLTRRLRLSRPIFARLLMTRQHRPNQLAIVGLSGTTGVARVQNGAHHQHPAPASVWKCELLDWTKKWPGRVRVDRKRSVPSGVFARGCGEQFVSGGFQQCRSEAEKWKRSASVGLGVSGKEKPRGVSEWFRNDLSQVEYNPEVAESSSFPAHCRGASTRLRTQWKVFFSPCASDIRRQSRLAGSVRSRSAR